MMKRPQSAAIQPSGADGDGGERRYFDSWEAMEALFAGNLARNLKEAGRRLGVQFVARDTWIKIGSSDARIIEKASAFLSELGKLASMAGAKPVDQRDFEQILAAYQDNRENELQSYFSERIKVSPKKRDIVPRTRTQLDYVKCMRERDIVFGVGPAGTGKTYLAMAMAVAELLSGKYDRIILTRPAVEAGESLGFLPGNIEEKINPYLRPLYDALYDMLPLADASALIERNVIEVAPLAFMRGRTLNNAFIILDEAQNATVEQMLMFLTRLGFNSQCVVAGDPSQTDLPTKRLSGLLHAMETLSSIEEIKVCRFSSKDVVRHSLVEKIVNAYQSRTAEGKEG
jgi:phosphate starvation-inducible protein PhoH and related proteins